MRESMREVMSGVPHNGKPKLAARSTVRYTREDGAEVVRFHHTDIVVKRTVGKKSIVRLDTGGWKTVTTKARINDYIGNGLSVFSDRGVWYVGSVGQWRKDDGAVPFYDGIEIIDGKLPKPKKSVESRERKLGKEINAFVKRLDAFKDKPLPMPEAGDCWLCSFHTSDGKTMGELHGKDGDHEHLTSHIREGYLHGSLLVNAFRWAGWTDFLIHFEFEKGRNVQPNDRRMAKSALRRYLRHKLGLAQ